MPVRVLPGCSAPGRGIGMNEERRCLVIDEQPAVRLGVRGLLADRYEVEEATDGQDALELISSIGDFDVAIVELVLAANGTADSLLGIPAIRALHRARPGLGIVAHGSRPEHHAATEAMDAGATAYVAKSSPTLQLARAVDAAAEAETFVDPAARGFRQARAHPPPAPDPPALRRRPLDRDRRSRARAQHRDDPHPHQGRARPAGGARPNPRGRDRPQIRTHRIARGRDATPHARTRKQKNCPRRSRGPLIPARAEDVAGVIPIL